MKFTLLTITLFAMTQPFEITIKQELTMAQLDDDAHVQQCVDVILAMQKDVKMIIDDLKHNKPQDVIVKMLDLFTRTQDAKERCTHLTPEEINNYLYHHLNRDGQKCVDGVLKTREVVNLIEELTHQQICFRQFIENVDPYIQALPDLVDACKNAHIHKE